jgi:hypothetical protein
MASFSIGKNRIIINGANIHISGNSVFVDDNLVEGVETDKGILEVRVLEGMVNNITTKTASVKCGDVTGAVNAGGSVDCDNVGGDVKAEGSVNCGDVKGNVKAEGMVNCGNIGGELKADGLVMRR